MSDTAYEEHSTDVLVIGAGGAGMRAAIEAHDDGADVTLIGKTLRGKAHTAMAEGGIAAPLGNVDPEDSWQQHAADTMRDGIWINDYRLVERLAQEASEIIKELESYGAIFDRTEDGKIQQRAFGAHTYKRTCHIGDRTGLEIMNVLTEQLVKRDVPIVEEVFITRLTDDEGAVTGAIGLNYQDGSFHVFKAKTVIIATGGFAEVYKRTTNPWETTGDGQFMAFDAGAELMDMELVQFHPTGLVYPPSAAGILVTESVRGEGGRLFNSEGDRFMEEYEPEWMELAPRDVVARAIYDEVHAGRGTEHGGAHLDITHKDDAYIEKKLPKMVGNLQDLAGVDVRKEPVEVAPTAHYTMGGIYVDPETMESTVDNLFAAGEATAQVHGANRLGSNSLTDILVFGRLAGKQAADAVAERAFPEDAEDITIDTGAVEQEITWITDVIGNEEDAADAQDPFELKEDIGEVMWEEAGIYRTEDGLNDALEQLDALHERIDDIVVPGSLRYNHGVLAYLSLRSMFLCSEAIVKSALERDESRGAHQREDHPELDDDLYNVVCVPEDGGVAVRRESVPEPDEELLEVLQDEQDCPY